MPAYIIDQEIRVYLDPPDDGATPTFAPENVVLVVTGHAYDGNVVLPFAVTATKAYDAPWVASEITDLLTEAKEQAFPV